MRSSGSSWLSTLLSCYGIQRNLSGAQRIDASTTYRAPVDGGVPLQDFNVTRYPMPPLGHAGDMRRVDPRKTLACSTQPHNPRHTVTDDRRSQKVEFSLLRT